MEDPLWEEKLKSTLTISSNPSLLMTTKTMTGSCDRQPMLAAITGDCRKAEEDGGVIAASGVIGGDGSSSVALEVQKVQNAGEITVVGISAGKDGCPRWFYLVLLVSILRPISCVQGRRSDRLLL